MGTVYKETFTKPLPTGAKIIVRKGQRLAQWQDAKGRTRTAALTASGDRITVEAGTYSAKYRDGSGIARKVATGCSDESAARFILTEVERRAVRVKGKLITAAEDAMIDHQETPLADHVIPTGNNTLPPSPRVPTTGKPRKLHSILDQIATKGDKGGEAGPNAVSPYLAKRKDPLTIAVSGSSQRGRRGSNPQPPDRQSGTLTN